MIFLKNIRLFLIGVLLLPQLAYSQIPDYYSVVDFSSSSVEIKSQLLELLKENHIIIPYTSSSTDTWDVLSISDKDSSLENNVILIYGFDDIDNEFINDRLRGVNNKTSWILDENGDSKLNFDATWNREHIFAKSLNSPDPELKNNIAFTDLHNLRAIDARMNSFRNNNFFTDGKGNSSLNENGFYPGDEWIGDVARTIMYMYIRYPDFCLPLNVGFGSSTLSDDKKMLDIFLEWNQLDPPSEFEIYRNEVIYSFQGNRNPFVDNPYLATLIWGGPSAVDLWSELPDDIIVYPIVTSSEIYLDTSPFLINFLGTYKDKTDKKFTYKLYNLDGEEVQSGNTFFKIDISDKLSGNYILELVIDKKIREVQIIKL